MMGLLSLYLPDSKRLKIESSLGFDDEYLKSLANTPSIPRFVALASSSGAG